MYTEVPPTLLSGIRTLAVLSSCVMQFVKYITDNIIFVASHFVEHEGKATLVANNNIVRTL